MPALFAFGSHVLGPTVATYAAFGSFAMLLLADFGGTTAERLAAQVLLIATGSVLLCVATLASRSALLAAGAMLVVGFGVLFAGIVSSVLAAATASVLLAFILPVATPATAAAIPDRLAGWLLAGAVSLPAITLLWPAPVREPLRDAAADACRALSARLTAEGRQDGHGDTDRDVAVAVADAVDAAAAAVDALRARFFATPYRPTGLTTADRAVVRLVDEVVWLSAVLDRAAGTAPGAADPGVRAVKTAAAVLLDHAGKALGPGRGPEDSLRGHLDDLARARSAMEDAATAAAAHSAGIVGGVGAAGVLRSLDPSFRAQEMTFAVTAVAANVEVAISAARRSWWQKVLGRQPAGIGGSLAAAQERALAHVEPHSVWLHNSVRGAVALAGAVLVADLSGVEHSFWIVLGTLSVLRSNALSTGQNALRGLAGTTAGFVVGGLLVAVLGADTAVLWVLLPVAILVAGIAPAFSFTAGQAGFTVTLVVLFNIVSPVGWQVGLVRVEDIAIGCAVSLVVGALFWPRGAGAALARALSEAYAESAAYLRVATETGAVATRDAGAVAPPGRRPDATRPPGVGEQPGSRAAAAARRLDDAFRGFLAERGTKQLPLADVATLLTGVAELRLTADAVRDLWRTRPAPGARPPAEPMPPSGRPADRAADATAERAADHAADPAMVDPAVLDPRSELVAATERVTNWYAAMALALVGRGPVPAALGPDPGADSRLVQTLRRPGGDTTREVRLIWTTDHVDAVRQLQTTLEQPARAAARYRLRSSPATRRG